MPKKSAIPTPKHKIKAYTNKIARAEMEDADRVSMDKLTSPVRTFACIRWENGWLVTQPGPKTSYLWKTMSREWLLSLTRRNEASIFRPKASSMAELLRPGTQSNIIIMANTWESDMKLVFINIVCDFNHFMHNFCESNMKKVYLKVESQDKRNVCHVALRRNLKVVNDS